ncbi:hypothetical protein PAXRUDRAFT_28614 [Paxillus rubicundulus Ve08.2h10]|uniref:Uncharacterized protein n=1 Tax=Paxillus rubicundulus Ve08.2h10 TaxID=930991 RepID=A0A0D0C5T0_9AGAM|nr:hypothetical protein PAXRUDRAFT_28614 [Paxillus rubicundulus Ve08.2h10]
MAQIQHTKKEKQSMHKQHVVLLEALAITQLADADNNDETLLGLMIGVLALEEKKLAQSKKYGLWGSYDQLKSNDFHENLLHHSSECQFKAWFRSLEGIHNDQSTISSPPFSVNLEVNQALRLQVHRDFISSEMAEWGFPGCIGIGNGSYIPLLYKPVKNGYAYWCCKKYYAIKLTFPYPGYSLMKHSACPFNEFDLTNNPEEATSMILHTLFEELGDDPTTIKGFNGRDEEDVVEVRGEGPI